MRWTSGTGFRLWVIRALIFGVVVAGGVYLLGRASTDEDSGSAAQQSSSVASGVVATDELPSAPSRLREGARQIKTALAARAAAQQALSRVEDELGSASGPEEVQRLQRKQALILEAMARLEAARDE
jgi:hypothetical protein